MKTERKSVGDFLFVFILSQVFNDINDNWNKRPKVYVSYIYMRIKYKSLTVYIKN